ncbi:hypothetical protein GCM10027285_08380 [Oleiagrimonas citrea]
MQIFLVAVLATGCAEAGNAFPVKVYGGFVLKGSAKSPQGVDQWNQWLQQAWRNPDGDPLAFAVGKDGAKKAEVGNCEQLFSADRQGLELVQPLDRMIYRGWAAKCYAARLIRDGKSSRVSHVSGFRFDRAHVDRLPVGMRFVVSPSDQGDDGHKTLGPFLRKAKMEFSNQEDSMYAFVTYPDGRTQAITLVARGDFDHDGTEDLLFRSYNRMNGGGSYASLAMYLVSRSGGASAMRVVKRIPVMGPGYDD